LNSAGTLAAVPHRVETPCAGILPGPPALAAGRPCLDTWANSHGKPQPFASPATVRYDTVKDGALRNSANNTTTRGWF